MNVRDGPGLDKVVVGGELADAYEGAQGAGGAGEGADMGSEDGGPVEERRLISRGWNQPFSARTWGMVRLVKA